MVEQRDLISADQALVHKLYQQMANESCSRALDEQILAMARANMPKAKNQPVEHKAKGALKSVVSIAASVAVLAALFWQYQDVFLPNSAPAPSLLAPELRPDFPDADQLVFQETASSTQLRSRQVAEEITATELAAPAYDDVIEQLRDAPAGVESMLLADENRLADKAEAKKLEQLNLIELEKDAKSQGGILAVSSNKPETSDLPLGLSLNLPKYDDLGEATPSSPTNEAGVAEVFERLDILLTNIYKRPGSAALSKSVSAKNVDGATQNVNLQTQQTENLERLYQTLLELIKANPAVKVDKKYLEPLPQSRREQLTQLTEQ